MKGIALFLSGLVLGSSASYVFVSWQSEEDLKIRLAYWITRDLELASELGKGTDGVAALLEADVVCARDLLESMGPSHSDKYKDYVADAIEMANTYQRKCTDFAKE